MTTDLEKQFFDTFGIKPREFKSCDVGTFCPYEGQLCDDTCPYYRTYKVDYPEITDRILLELICIATASEITVEFKGIKNVEHLKEVVLNYCIERYGYCLHKDKFKHQVQALFKENNYDR